MAITPKSGKTIGRRKIAGMEATWTKMFDPPKASLQSPPDAVVSVINPAGDPDPASPYYNPVPAFMTNNVPNYGPADHFVERELMGTLKLDTWDGTKEIDFMVFRDPDSGDGGIWPAPTIRHPRGKLLQCITKGSGPPPHTIHWHGQEPTPMNDGVGHCSIEIGDYTYQLQPNFIGTYFYHCHRNTVQHFEWGLYGMLLIEPPDAYDPSIPNVQREIDLGIGKNVGGYPRRTAANLPPADYPQFTEEFVGGDSTFGVGNATDDGVGDPHAFTVAYDVEALWVLDDRDSVWSELATSPKAFYPGGANTQDSPGGELLTPIVSENPGVDDQFPVGFFNDYNADYWYVTGVPVPADQGGTAAIPTGLLVPPSANGGVTGMRVDVAANTDQTVLVRCLNAAYNTIEVTFPIDVTIIAWDGRALGVPPFARYNHAYDVPANTPVKMSTARRFDALIRSSVPVDDVATVKFYDTRGLDPADYSPNHLVTAEIPIVITDPS